MSELYQREIEEILQQVVESAPDKESKEADRGPLFALLYRIARGIGDAVYLSSGRLMTIGIVLLVAAILVSAILPGLFGPFVWLGLILFILVYAMFFAGPKLKVEKRWRGRPISTPPYDLRGKRLWGRFQWWLKR